MPAEASAPGFCLGSGGLIKVGVQVSLRSLCWDVVWAGLPAQRCALTISLWGWRLRWVLGTLAFTLGGSMGRLPVSSPDALAGPTDRVGVQWGLVGRMGLHRLNSTLQPYLYVIAHVGSGGVGVRSKSRHHARASWWRLIIGVKMGSTEVGSLCWTSRPPSVTF